MTGKLVTSLRIDFYLPDDTVFLERTRHVETMATHDLLQCFAGNVSFINPNNNSILLALTDVPLFRFASDIFDALQRLLRGDHIASFTDFYGEFQVNCVRLNSTDVRIENAFSGQSLTVPAETLIAAYNQAITKLYNSFVSSMPELLNNENFCILIAEIAELCID